MLIQDDTVVRAFVKFGKVKLEYSETCIKRTPSIKRTVAKVPKFISLVTLNETFIKRTPLLSGHGHLKSTWNGHFYRCQPVLNGHL